MKLISKTETILGIYIFV